MISVVVRSTMLGCRHVIPSMAAGGAPIALTTSSKRQVGSHVRTGIRLAKVDLDQLVRMAATEYGPVGIRCNEIRPVSSPHLVVCVRLIRAILSHLAIWSTASCGSTLS
jgi:NAD(P)-dependent dehydrogenase (short-subunit alcohol dehydrogenase family)